MDENEYRIKVSVRNNLILKAIEDFGYTSVTKFCAENDLKVGNINALISFKVRPIGQDGNFSKHAQALMEVLGAAPTDLWTAEQLELRLPKNSAQKTIGQRALDKLLGMDNGELVAIETPDEKLSKREGKVLIVNTLESLYNEREQYVIVNRFGLGCEEKTLDELSEELDVTRERVRQIEAKALRKLRRHGIASKLKEQFYDD